MAKRNSQGAAIPEMQRGSAISAGSPQVNYGMTSGAARNAGLPAYTLAGVLGDISRRVEDRLDVQAQVEAERAGTLAGQEGVPERRDDTTIRGRAFNIAARDALAIRVDIEGRRVLSEYEEKFPTDAGRFSEAAQGYVKGHLQELQAYDPALAQRFQGEFELRKLSAEGRIKDRHRAVVRDQQTEQALRYQLSIQDELQRDAADLFSGNAANAEATLARMMGNAGKMVDAANSIGPDGQPLFSARERIAAERQAETAVSEQMGLAWLRTQGNVIDAYHTWQKGDAVLSLDDGAGNVRSVNLREIMGERGYQLAAERFTEQIRSELSLQSQMDAAQDRAFNRSSDALFADMTVAAQEGALSLDMVDAARRSLEPDRYLALRSLAKNGGAAVSNGAVYSDLAIKDADGQDIRDELRVRYEAGDLARDDMLKLYASNTARIDRGTKDPVQTGRDYLSKGLGALSSEIGMAQSVSIGGADAEYDIEVERFIASNDRQPSYSEARDLAEKVRARYSVLSVEDSLIALPLPQSMTQAEKLNRNTDSDLIAKKIKSLDEVYLKKYNGDIEALAEDTEYLREGSLLKQYFELLKLKETGNARSTRGQ